MERMNGGPSATSRRGFGEDNKRVKELGRRSPSDHRCHSRSSLVRFLLDGSKEFLNKQWRDFTGLSLEESYGWGWQVAVRDSHRNAGTRPSTQRISWSPG